jgi:hypothetical protein
MTLSEKKITIFTGSEDYFRFIGIENIKLLSEQFSSSWKCNGITTKEINNWLVKININSKIDFVQLIMEIWEKQYCTFFEYGRVIFNNDNWYYINNSHFLARNNVLNISMLDKRSVYPDSKLIKKISELKQENLMLKKKIYSLQ